MQVIFQFCLIAIFLEGAFSGEDVCYNSYACVNFKIYSLKIPNDNPRIKGEKRQADDDWYTYINWLDNPAGNLTLSYESQAWVHPRWKDKSSGTVNVYENGKSERFDWAQLTRKALGLNNAYVKIPGKVRVNRNLFSRDKCIGINFETPWETGLKYRIFLTVTDNDKHVYLTGQIVRHPQY